MDFDKMNKYYIMFSYFPIQNYTVFIKIPVTINIVNNKGTRHFSSISKNKCLNYMLSFKVRGSRTQTK